MTGASEYFSSLEPEQFAAVFRNNPDTLDIMVIFMLDLFVFGSTPEEQARANKAREMLQYTGLLQYGEGEHRGSPSLESVKGLLRKILT